MKHFELIRISDFYAGTFGVLLEGVEPFCLTLERTWLDNRKGESCIPKGRYICKRIISPKFGETFEVTNVQGRSEILFHKGNIEDDTHGCIVLGEQYEPVLDHYGVAASGKAFSEFMARLVGEEEFELLIWYARER